MENALIKSEVDFNNPQMIETLKNTVAKDLNNHEFIMFAELCKSSGLNPFRKEIWAIKAGGRLQLMTGAQGFFTIANRHPEYDGIESGLIDPNGDYKPLAYPKNDFIGAWARVYRKDRKMPTEGIAMVSEYQKPTPIWKQMTRVMILKCAESIALRKAFPQEMNGLYTSEEMPQNYSASQAQAPQVIVAEKEAINTVTGEVYEIRYAIPYADEAARKAVKQNGFTFEKESKHWVGCTQVVEAEQYRVGAVQQDEPMPQIEDDDDLPF